MLQQFYQSGTIFTNWKTQFSHTKHRDKIPTVLQSLWVLITTNNWLYFGNNKRHAHSYYATLIGSNTFQLQIPQKTN